MDEKRFCTASCEKCGEHIEFPAEGVGMRVSCPHCKLETVLVESSPTSSETGPEVTATELSAAFEGEGGEGLRPRVSFGYQVGLGVVAVFMVLLPAAYFSLALLLGYFVCWYAVHARGLFSSAAGGIYLMILKASLYIGPILGGTLAVLFMFKPLLARRIRRDQPLELILPAHPRLYQLIAHLSRLLRVPMPDRVFLSSAVEAAGGMLSFRGKQLVLTLGLTLVAGLNTQQFTAVVAHELGHCTQRWAMRLSFVIESLNRWFIRVICERDSWDEMLDEWANSAESWPVVLVVVCAHLGVGFSRLTLKALMWVGRAVSCLLMRQMEYHADSCAIAVVGSEGLEKTLIRLRELDVLEHLGHGVLAEAWTKRRQLPDDIPVFLDEFERRLPSDFHEQARLTLLNETAGLFATHPVANQRIRRARQRPVRGVFNLEKPARSLFSDFETPSREVTRATYLHVLGLMVTRPVLKPAREFFNELSPDRGATGCGV